MATKLAWRPGDRVLLRAEIIGLGSEGPYIRVEPAVAVRPVFGRRPQQQSSGSRATLAKRMNVSISRRRSLASTTCRSPNSSGRQRPASPTKCAKCQSAA